MAQPIRKIKKKEIKEENFGIEFCNDCPFLILDGQSAHCNASDVRLEFDDIDSIPVPKNCGNNKHTWKN